MFSGPWGGMGNSLLLENSLCLVGFANWSGSRRVDRVASGTPPRLGYSALMVAVPTQRPWGEGHTFFSPNDEDY